MKRTLTAILLLTSLLLISCAGDTADSVTTSDSTTETTTAETETTEPPSLVPDGLDFDGATFRLLGGHQVFTIYTQATELNGDVLNDALYERYRTVSEEINVNFEFDWANPAPAVDKLGTTILAGEDVYHMGIMQRTTRIANMVSSGYLTNYNDLPYIDLDRTYWLKTAIDNLTVGDYTYYTLGDIYPMSAHIVYYNTPMQTAYGLESPQDYVLDGTWTIDKLTEMATGVSKDLNGDSVMDEKDQYGISFYHYESIASMMFGAGLSVTEHVGDSVELCGYNDKTLEVFGKIYDIFNKGDICFSKKLNQLNITSGQLLFCTGEVHAAHEFRSAELDFGILPYPKYDEKQENYISYLNTELMCIPSTADYELAGATVQLLAENSGGVKTAYYEYLLKEKVARDSESARVLDLIFANAVTDFGVSFCGGTSTLYDIYQIPTDLVLAGSSDYVSSYEKMAEAASNELENVLEMLYNQ